MQRQCYMHDGAMVKRHKAVGSAGIAKSFLLHCRQHFLPVRTVTVGIASSFVCPGAQVTGVQEQRQEADLEHPVMSRQTRSDADAAKMAAPQVLVDKPGTALLTQSEMARLAKEVQRVLAHTDSCCSVPKGLGYCNPMSTPAFA